MDAFVLGWTLIYEACKAAANRRLVKITFEL